jgi:hypothetical protein
MLTCCLLEPRQTEHSTADERLCLDTLLLVPPRRGGRNACSMWLPLQLDSLWKAVVARSPAVRCNRVTAERYSWRPGLGRIASLIHTSSARVWGVSHRWYTRPGGQHVRTQRRDVAAAAPRGYASPRPTHGPDIRLRRRRQNSCETYRVAAPRARLALRWSASREGPGRGSSSCTRHCCELPAADSSCSTPG